MKSRKIAKKSIIIFILNICTFPLPSSKCFLHCGMEKSLWQKRKKNIDRTLSPFQATFSDYVDPEQLKKYISAQ